MCVNNRTLTTVTHEHITIVYSSTPGLISWSCVLLPSGLQQRSSTGLVLFGLYFGLLVKRPLSRTPCRGFGVRASKGQSQPCCDSMDVIASTVIGVQAPVRGRAEGPGRQQEGGPNRVMCAPSAVHRFLYTYLKFDSQPSETGQTGTGTQIRSNGHQHTEQPPRDRSRHDVTHTTQ